MYDAANDRPVVGAAVKLESLETHRDWILERQRDVELQMFIDAEVLNGDWSGRADRVRALLDGHTGRLGLHGPFWGLSVVGLDPEVRMVVQKRLDQALDVAQAVGGDQIVIHSPVNLWTQMNFAVVPHRRQWFLDRIAETLRPALTRAESQGVTFVLENIEDADPAARRHLIDQIGSPALALSIDTGHAHWAHVATGAPPVDAFVMDAGTQLQHVHLQDADGQADRHWPIGMGTINWAAVFAALARSAPQARLILELEDHDGIRPSAERLETLGLVR